MEIRTTITLLSIVAILAGVYSIYASIKNTHKNHSQHRAKHRIIQNVLGINGARIFYGLLGFGLILFGLFILFQSYVKPKLGNEYNNKTDKFILVSETVTVDGFSVSSNLTTTLKQLNNSIKILGKSELDKYVQVSFRNNYLEKIPDLVWEMKNLKAIDLTFNNISKLDVKKLSKMEKLKVINLSNNPISKKSIEILKKETNIEIKY